MLSNLLILPLLFASVSGQTTSPPAPKISFFDHDGKSISNNEFVDIRMANFHYPDKTLVSILSDGSTQFRLQKIPQEGAQVPPFSVTTLDDKVLSAANLRGKVVVIHFWFIGCEICRAHKPKLNALSDRFNGNDDVVFLAITYNRESDVRKVLVKQPLSFRHAADANAAVKQFAFSGYPKNIVVSKTGEIVYWRSPVQAWEKFESVINEELRK